MLKPAETPSLPRSLWAALCASRIVLFLAVVFNRPFCFEGDSHFYLTIAKNLWTLHAFRTATVETLFPPGYPLFLAPFVGMLQSPVLPIIFAQSVLSVATAYFAWRWMSSIMRRDQAIIGFLFFAFDWIVCVHTVVILADCLMLFFLAAAVFFTQRSADSAAPADSAAAGFSWSLAAFVKPINIYLPILWGLCRITKRKRAAVFLLCAYTLPAFWVLRNFRETGHAFYTSMGGMHLLTYEAGPIQSLATGVSPAAYTERMKAQVDATLPPNAGDYERGQAYAKVARDYILSHPGLTLKYNIYGAIKLLGGTGLEMFWDLVSFQSGRATDPATEQTPAISGKGTLSLLKRHPILIPVELGYLLQLAALYILFAKGIYRLFRNHQGPLAWSLLGPVLYYLILSSHVRGYHYRLPLVLFLAAGTGLGSRRISEWR